MGDSSAIWYRKSYINRFKLAVLLFIVFISVLFCPSVASAVVDVTLAWDANTETDLKGYKVYCRVGAAPSKTSYDRQIVILKDDLADPDHPQYVVDNVSETQTTYFAATAYNLSDAESGFSNVESYTGSVANQSPNASFTAGPTTGNLPLLVYFDGSGSDDPDGTISFYSWNFGDGATASGITTSHTYNSAGNYTATLTVTDDDGATDSSSIQIVGATRRANE